MAYADLLTYLAVSLGINTVLFLIAFWRKSDKLTDLSYAISFIALAVLGLSRSDQTPYHFLLLIMVVAWATRLGGFLVYRILRSGTDQRFDGVRDNFVKFGKFWLGQALAVWVIMLPSILAFGAQSEISLLAVIGAGIWAIGLWVETQSDLQKITFRNNPKNKDKWISSGLWKYSRHPNYFGEILVWVGVYIYALASLSFLQGIVGLAGPLLITNILLFVSGIPPLETYADNKWGSVKSYQRYKARTSILIPLPPRDNT